MDSADYRAILLGDYPLLDVRAPVEFNRGAFPAAVNRPLLTDSERQRVGTCYRQQGQEAAIALGHKLLAGDLKAERIAAWVAFARAHPEGYLYCFRGGLRSQLSQQWLKEVGAIGYPRIVGGYKAMRSFLLEELESAVAQCRFVVLGGLTGTGKTDVLTTLANGLDLEGCANHRGSSFGKHASSQPTQINFEHQLTIDLVKKRSAGIRQFVVEDEGRNIGSCALPLALYNMMSHCPVVWLEDRFECRVARIVSDYVVDLHAEFVARYGEEQGFNAYALRLRDSLDRIRKRLGGERHQRLAAIMVAALDAQRRSGAVALHRDWIAGLLREYYDPMYGFQRRNKAQRIVFRGDREAVSYYLREGHR